MKRIEPSSWLAAGSVGLAVMLSGFVVTTVERTFLSYPAGVSAPQDVHRVLVQRRSPSADLLAAAPVISLPELRILAGAFRGEAEVAGYSTVKVAADVRGTVHVVTAVVATDNYFRLLGVRTSGAADWSATATTGLRSVLVSPTLVGLTHGEQGDQAKIKTIYVNGQQVPLGGTVDRSFVGLDGEQASLWIPMPLAEQLGLTPSLVSYDAGFLSVIVRATHGISAGAIAARVASAVHSLDDQGASLMGGRREAIIVSLRDDRFDAARTARSAVVALLLILAAVMLFIGIGNALIVVLLRILRNERQIATKLALGATYGTVQRDYGRRSAVVALCGCAAATIALALVLNATVNRGYLPPLNKANSLTVRFVAGATVIVPMLLAAASAWFVTRVQMSASLRSGAGIGAMSPATRRLSLALLSLQTVCVVSVVTVGAMLAIATRNAVRADYGYELTDLYAVTFTDDVLSPEASRQRAERVETVLRRDPFVRSISFSTIVPFVRYAVETQLHREATQTSAQWMALSGSVDTAFISTLGLRLIVSELSGTASGSTASTKVVISRSLAAALGGPEQSLGRCVGPTTAQCRQVIGVVENAAFTGRGSNEKPLMLTVVPALSPEDRGILVLRAKRGARAMPAEIYGQLRRVGFTPSSVTIESLKDLSERSYAQWLEAASLCVTVSILALIGLANGIVSVALYYAEVRSNELAIRLAFGARPRNLYRTLGGPLAVVSALGISIGSVAGTAGAWLVERFVGPMVAHLSLILVATGGAIFLLNGIAVSWPIFRLWSGSPAKALR